MASDEHFTSLTGRLVTATACTAGRRPGMLRAAPQAFVGDAGGDGSRFRLRVTDKPKLRQAQNARAQLQTVLALDRPRRVG